MMINNWRDAFDKVSSDCGHLAREAVHNEENNHWTWKNSRRLGLYTPYDRIGASITVLSVLVSISLTWYGKPLTACLTAFGISIGLLIGLDSFGYISTVLSMPTRNMIVAADLIILIAMWYPVTRMIVTAIVVTVLSASISILFNKRWLRAENWFYSESVQHGVNRDPECESEIAWRAWGKTECRTLYGSLGYPIDDSVIDTYAKPVFFATFFKLKGKWKSNEERIETLKERNSKLSDDISNIEIELELYKSREESANNNLDEERSYQRYLKDELDKMIKLNAQLTVANNELIESLNEQKVVEIEKVKPDIDMTPEQRCVLLLKETDLSFRKISELVGFSKSKVAKINQDGGYRNEQE